jgi:hypothetical protein
MKADGRAAPLGYESAGKTERPKPGHGRGCLQAVRSFFGFAPAGGILGHH